MAVSKEVEREGDEWSDFADISSNSNTDRFSKVLVINYGNGYLDQCNEKIASCFPTDRSPARGESLEGDLDSRSLRRVSVPVNNLSGRSTLDSISCILHRAAGTTGCVRQPRWRGSQMEALLLKSLHLNSEEQHIKKTGSNECDGAGLLQEIFNFHGFTERGYTSLSPTSEVWSDDKEEAFFTSSDAQEPLRSDQVKLDRAMSVPFMSRQSEQEHEWCDRSSTGSDEILFVFGKPQFMSNRHSLFDECQAAAGLSALSIEELLDLKNEMSDCATEYSDVLVEELTSREDLIREKELKNKFISSLLALQSRIRNIRQSQTKKRLSFGNSDPPGKYLTTVIPYSADEGGPNTGVLEKIVKIMDAMTGDSPALPTLLTDYILKVLCGT